MSEEIISAVTQSSAKPEIEPKSSPSPDSDVEPDLKLAGLLTSDPLNLKNMFYYDSPGWDEESFPQYFPSF